MIFHKNSQKRFYLDDALYFITTNTYRRDPYFNEDIFCELLIDEINLCMDMKHCNLIGYKINPDHVHLLIKPGNNFNYSMIMRCIKLQFSRDINSIIKGDIPECRLNGYQDSYNLQRRYDIINYRYYHDTIMKMVVCPIPLFKWQKSFHYHINENERDYCNHLYYLQHQWIKHGLKENKWLYIA
jgi:putative transposase